MLSHCAEGSSLDGVRFVGVPDTGMVRREPVSDEAQERFRVLYETHRDAVYRYALRRVGPDTAPDVVAEVFLVAWRRLDEVPTRILPWLYGVARKTVANQLRATDRYARLTERVGALTPAQPAGASGVEAAVVASTTIAASFDRLDADDREVLTLVAWEGLSSRDASAVLGCGVPAVTMRLSRARRRLRAALEDEGNEEV